MSLSASTPIFHLTTGGRAPGIRQFASTACPRRHSAYLGCVNMRLRRSRSQGRSRSCIQGLITWIAVALSAALTALTGPTLGAEMMDIPSLFAAAQQEGRVGSARKSKPVDARLALPGEVVITTIAGEGKETQSKPAEPGDMVVRNRCEATGHEQYLVKASKFAGLYEGPLGGEDAEGWQAYRPHGAEMRYFIVRDQ